MRVEDGLGANSVHSEQVENVAVLNLVGPGPSNLNHFFQCKTSTGNVADLVWEKDGQKVRFYQRVSIGSKKMDMSRPLVAAEGAVQPGDAGLYTCRDTTTQENRSISIRAGESYRFSTCSLLCSLWSL